MEQQSDARDAFRVSQKLVFEFKPVDEATAEKLSPAEVFDQSQAANVLSQLKKIDREANKTLKILSDKNRLLGDYLTKLNQKIDLLARYSLFTHEQDQGTVNVSLSETGVSFAHPVALEAAALLAIRMVFLPDYIPMLVYARVVRSIADNGAYQIAAEFYKLSDKERQELAKQVFKAQIQHRKQQR